MKQRQWMLTVAIAVAGIAVSVGLAALRGWGPDPWWQGQLVMVATVVAVGWVWRAYGTKKSKP